MENDEVLGAETAQASLATQLAAVELLLRRKDRDVARNDILLATVFELLEQGDLSLGSIHSGVCRTWPGVVVSISEIEAVLSAAERVFHVQRRLKLDGHEAWTLLPAGEAELQTARAWAGNVEARFRAQLADEARSLFGELKFEDVDSWLAITIAALRDCVARSFTSANFVGLDTISGRWLYPVSIDVDECLRFIDHRVRQPETADFLKSVVTLALEPSAAFGTELVHHLVTGYLLYLFMAAKRAADETAVAGPIAGEVLILDTPVLFHMTKPTSHSMAIKELIAVALDVGVQVVLFERTVAEFSRKLEGHETYDVPRIEGDLRAGTDPFLLAELVRGDELLRNWLLWFMDDGGSWSDYRAALEGRLGPVGMLRAMGVRLLSDSPFSTIAETARYEQLKTDLTNAVTVGSKVTRSARVIEHDSALLLEAYRARIKNPADDQKIWPGAFILTTDNHLNNAFDATAGAQTIPVALSFSAFGAIVASYASPRHSEELAFKIAGDLTDVAFMTRSTTIPLDLARQLATTLSGEAKPGPTDIHQLQLNVVSLLRRQPDLFDRSGEEYERYVGEIVASRRKRLTRAREREQEEVRNEQHRSELAQTRQQQKLEAEKRRRKEVEDELATAATELTDKSKRIDTVIQEGKRKVVLASLTSATFVLMIIFTLIGKLAAAGFLMFSLVILAGTGWGWATKDSNSWPVAVAVVVAAIGGVWATFF